MKWKKEGTVCRLLDESGWTRAVVWKEASWGALAPLGLDGRVVESLGHKTRLEARRWAENVVKEALR